MHRVDIQRFVGKACLFHFIVAGNCIKRFSRNVFAVLALSDKILIILYTLLRVFKIKLLFERRSHWQLGFD